MKRRAWCAVGALANWLLAVVHLSRGQLGLFGLFAALAWHWAMEVRE